MKVKITPIGESAQLIEFNVSLPCGARASVAPVSTLTITQRWAKVINTATTGAASYMQVTKFDIIHNTQYTDCKGNVRLVTEETSTILASPATSETITTLVPEVNKVIDVIIPNGVSIVNQAILDELPTSLPVKGNCAYSVFEIQIPAAAENLLATIRKSKEYIQSQIKAKEEKVNTLLELMESDPEMKKRFDELMMNKTAK